MVFSLLWYTIPLRWAGQVTAISDETRLRLEKEFPRSAKGINVISNCVDPVFFDQEPNCRPSGKPRVLQIGAATNKNLERLVDAVSGLPVHLRIIGKVSPEQEELLSIKGIDWSFANGLSFEALVAEYRSSRVVAFVSTYEGFGLPIIEAQAAGIPVVTSNIPPMSDVAGSGAILVDPDEPDQIRRAIVSVLHCRRLADRLIREGKLNVCRFDARLIADEYSKLYWRSLRAMPLSLS